MLLRCRTRGARRFGGVGITLGFHLLLERFDELEGVANGLARLGGVAQDFDERVTELREGVGFVPGGVGTSCRVGEDLVRQGLAHRMLKIPVVLTVWARMRLYVSGENCDGHVASM